MGGTKEGRKKGAGHGRHAGRRGNKLQKARIRRNSQVKAGESVILGLEGGGRFVYVQDPNEKVRLSWGERQ